MGVFIDVQAIFLPTPNTTNPLPVSTIY